MRYINCEPINTTIEFLIANVTKIQNNVNTKEYILHSSKKGIGNNFIIFVEHNYICLETNKVYNITQSMNGFFIVKEHLHDMMFFANALEPILKSLLS